MMVVEMWALKEPLEIGAVVEGRCYSSGAELERVRVLEDGEVAVPVSDVKAAIFMLGTSWVTGVVALQNRLRALLPAPPEPPTYEELESALRAVCADDGEDVAQSFARARALLERAEAARKGGA